MIPHVWTRIYPHNTFPLSLSVTPTHECTRCGAKALITDKNKIYPIYDGIDISPGIAIAANFYDDCDLELIDKINNS